MVSPVDLSSTSVYGPRLRRPTSSLRVLVSSALVFLVWLFILGLHSVNALVALVASATHLMITDPDIYKNIHSVQIPREELTIAGWSYCVVGLVHLYAVLEMVCRSVWHRRFVFHAPAKPLNHVSGKKSKNSCLNRLYTSGREGMTQFFGIDGHFGVNGKSFYLSFHTLEVLELVTQTYQAYQVSRSVSRAWIKQFSVAVIVINGIFPWLIHVLLRKNDGARRLVNVLIDLLLDFSSAVVLPVCIVAPYVRELDWATGTFDLELSYNDVWAANAIAENRQVYVTARFDYVASMMPHISFLLCLDMVKGLLHRAPERRKRRLERAPAGSTAITLADLCADVSELTSFYINKNKVMTTPMLAESSQTKQRKWMYHGFYYAFTVLWGLTVLAIHIQAESRGATPIPGCRLELTPWLARNASCSVMQINCYRDGQAGSSDKIAEPMKTLERSALTKVIITHCPALEVPPILHEFPRLHTFETFNSTVTAWPRSAAFTQKHHPYLFQVLLYDTNLSAIPDGLLHDELPETFEAFWIINSNIFDLPESIGDLWSAHK